MTFGEKLQVLRKSRGWTQEQLSEQIHVSRQTLSKWEQGSVLPDTEYVLSVSRLFQVSTDYLLCDEYDQPEQPLEKVPKGEQRDFSWLLWVGDWPSGAGDLGNSQRRFSRCLYCLAGGCGVGQGLHGPVGLFEDQSCGVALLSVRRIDPFGHRCRHTSAVEKTAEGLCGSAKDQKATKRYGEIKHKGLPLRQSFFTSPRRGIASLQ